MSPASLRPITSLPETSALGAAQPLPWWRFGMVWLVIGGPLAVIVAGFATLALALSHPDPVLEEGVAKAVLTAPDRHTPAVQARNHAGTAR